MSYQASVYNVLIASPSDVIAERKAIIDIIYSWNAVNSSELNIVLLPVMWETHSTPELGDRPQAIINRQLVYSCDILIATFWTRIGTNTGLAESGTIEEIEEFRRDGKTVMLYFSSVPVALESVDQEQYKKLITFKETCIKQGLIEKYESIAEFREKLSRQLTIKIRDIHSLTTTQENEDFPKNDEQDILEMSLEQFRSFINRSEIDWQTERDSVPLSIDEGKGIFNKLASGLMDYIIQFNQKISKSNIDELYEQITLSKSIQEHEVFLDGGESYKDFWKQGNLIFNNLNEIIHNIEFVTPKFNSIKDSLKLDLINKFKSINAKAGQTLPPKWLQQQYIPSLDPKRLKIIEDVINELISEEIIEYVDKPFHNLRLTQKGEGSIY